jgi:hypothetical protein
MNVKPIFIIRFPNYQVGNHRGETQEIMDMIQKKLKGYHILGLIDNSINQIQFECFNGPDDEKDFALLKEKADLILAQCEKHLAGQRDRVFVANQEWILKELQGIGEITEQED